MAELDSFWNVPTETLYNTIDIHIPVRCTHYVPCTLENSPVTLYFVARILNLVSWFLVCSRDLYVSIVRLGHPVCMLCAFSYYKLDARSIQSGFKLDAPIICSSVILSHLADQLSSSTLFHGNQFSCLVICVAECDRRSLYKRQALDMM